MPLPSLDYAPRRLLDGRVALVTGASGGLGRVLSLACAAQGATVVLHGRVVRKLEALYDDIVNAGYPEPTILPLDLATARAEDFANVASALQAQALDWCRPYWRCWSGARSSPVVDEDRNHSHNLTSSSVTIGNDESPMAADAVGARPGPRAG